MNTIFSFGFSKLFLSKYAKVNKIVKNNESTSKTLNWIIKPYREKENRSSAIHLDNTSVKKGGRFYHEKIILGYSRQQMCDLVFDVAKYQEFVPFCLHSEIIECNKDKKPFNLHLKKNINQFKLNLQQNQNKPVNILKSKNALELPQRCSARLEIGYPPIKESYISSVTMYRPYVVKAVSSESRLFEYLVNEWKFQKYDCSHPNKDIIKNQINEITDENCEEKYCLVEFFVSFKFHSVIYTEVANMFMEKMFKKMVEAFNQRAKQLYGDPNKIY
jgi:ribosome-associated toxin RatA of RatAB toxin-antitoxin module